MTDDSVEISIDIGSSSIKSLAFNNSSEIMRKICIANDGGMNSCLRKVLGDNASIFCKNRCYIRAITGSESRHYSSLLKTNGVDDVVAAFHGVKAAVPDAGAILEIGREQAKFITLSRNKGCSQTRINGIYLNSECSAGTGSLFEREAYRFGLTLDEFSSLALESKRSVNIAGRCAVFAKTDIVHKQQNGVPLEDIAYALCLMVAKNIKSELVTGRNFDGPLVVIGGVAANAGLIRALLEVFNLDGNSLIVPDDHSYLPARGAYLWSKTFSHGRGIPLEKAIYTIDQPATTPKEFCKSIVRPVPEAHSAVDEKGGVKTCGKNLPDTVLIGIDIGSTTTNIALVGLDGELIFSCTVATRGQAINSVYDCLSRLKNRYGSIISGAVGVTGSGRSLIARIIGADLAINEISAHAAGSLQYYPETDTIFDIGGQDSKFIKLSGNRVVEFEMNKVCSAGTGSFIEEMSQLLGMDIKTQFAAEALSSDSHAELSDRCGIFIGSELMKKLRRGYERKALAAGLCYSVVNNYLSRVVGKHEIGDRILFQGGVAANKAVVKAFENVLGKKILIHKYHEAAGAIGAALLARREVKHVSSHRDFRYSDIDSIKTGSFECGKCLNNCMVYTISSNDGKKYYSGGTCDRYDEMSSHNINTIRREPLDLFEKRKSILDRYTGGAVSIHTSGAIGLPRALINQELLPFWSTFLDSIGLRYILSDDTTPEIVDRGGSVCPTGPCLPVKTAYGHCVDLMAKGVDKIFIPMVSSLSFKTNSERLNHLCPAAQAWPHTTRSLFDKKVKFITPTVRFAIPGYFKRDIINFAKSMGVGRKSALQAVNKSLEAQFDYYERLIETGKTALAESDNNRIYAAILARPYVIHDRLIQSRLKKCLNKAGITGIPMEMIEAKPSSSGDLEGMYWFYGKRILQIAESLAGIGNIAVIFLSVFGCGPDSFIIHILRDRIDPESLLELELDQHADFTGIQTRLEAFAYSIKGRKKYRTEKRSINIQKSPTIPRRRKILIPQMSDHAFSMAAAFRAFGVDAEVLSLPDAKSTRLGLKKVSGEECLPCAMVTGDMLNFLRSRNGDSAKYAFFMISGDGPCRLGQYPYLQRKILDEEGFRDVPIFDASQDQDFYNRFKTLKPSFKKLAWDGFVAADLLYRKYREVRSSAKDRPACDRVYRDTVNLLSDTIEEKGNIPGCLRRTFDDLDNLKKNDTDGSIKIAVLGENYIRCNRFANNFLAEKLEKLGADVLYPSLYEWIFYTNWSARVHCLYEKRYKRYLKLQIINALQRFSTFRLESNVRGKLRNRKEPSLREIFKLSSSYINKTFEGETIIEISRAVDFARKGAAGVIRIVPFGCIVGTIVDTISERISRDLNDLPILTLHYDGTGDSVQDKKLAAFMMRAKQRSEEMERVLRA